MADEDPYESVSGGGLRLKGDKQKKKKKKNKKNTAEKILENATTQPDTHGSSDEKQEEMKVQKTPAEMAFEKAQEKRAAKRILEKASKTHKQRVEELNEYLGGLSEHYDIQKVSWTK